MRSIIRLLFATTFLVTTPHAFAKSLENVDGRGVGIQAYDPVAYFVDKQPKKGSAQIRSSYEGAVYYFATPEHKNDFDANPRKYVPQFGGFCAYGVSRGSVVEIDPTAFQIIDGRLLLQYSHGVLEKFNKDSVGNLKKANANWPLLLEKKGK